MPVLKFDPMSAVSLRVRKILAPLMNVFAMLTLIGRPKIPPRLAAASTGGGGAPGPPGTGGGSAPPVGGIAKGVRAAGAEGGGGLGTAACAAFKSSSCFWRLWICVWYCFWILRIWFCSSLIGSFTGVAVWARAETGRMAHGIASSPADCYRIVDISLVVHYFPREIETVAGG